MNSIGQLIWGNRDNGNVTTWIRRFVLIILVLLVAQVIINVVALLVSSCVHGLVNFIRDVISLVSGGFAPGDRVEGLTKLCLWLVMVIIILKIFIKR